jgi:hypothetical protein
VKSKKAILYTLTPQKFQKLSENIKIEFLKILNIYISNRVYKLNKILKNIKILTTLALKNKITLDEILKIFGNINEYYIFKKQKELPIISSNIYPCKEIIDFIENNIDTDLKI